MRGVKLAVAVLEVKEPAVAILSAEAYLVAQIMLIAALHMDKLAEDALLDHIEDSHFVPVVAAVLKQHTEFAGLLACPDKLPAFLYARRAADLHGNVLARSHRVYGNAGMGYPCGAAHDSVKVVPCEQFFIIEIPISGLAGGLLDYLSAPFGSVLIYIADCGYAHTIAVEQLAKLAAASAADTDNAYINCIFHQSSLPQRCYNLII